MSKCYLLFAEGFEECEGLVTLDILRRAGLEAYTVSIQDAHTVVGAHGVPITCDRTLPELLAAPPELVVLPGGMPGTTNLAKSPAVEALVRRPKKVFTKRELFQAAWNEEAFVEEKAVNVHVSNIRGKLKPSGTDGYIETVWGIGFKLAE